MVRGAVGRVLPARFLPSSSSFKFFRYSHTSETLSKEVTKGTINEEACLPLLQRCKSLLAANWRGQLSSVKQGEEALHGSLAPFAFIAGQAVVWLPKDNPHAANFLMDNRGSLVVGHTDPRRLIRTFKSLGHMPPRAVVMGLFDPVPSSEIEYIKKRMVKLVSSTKKAVENAGPRTQSILKESSASATARMKALDEMIHSSEEELNIYILTPRACQFVDLLGARHEVDVMELAAATADHLCPVQADLIDGINQGDSRRVALIMFCAVYMHVRVQDAYIFAADRWGINLLANVDSSEGQPSSKPGTQQGDWKEFRFGFTNEVHNTEQFCILLAEMERECVEALSKAQAGLENSSS